MNLADVPQSRQSVFVRCCLDEKLRLRIIAWNGIIFNAILDWAERGFTETPHELAIELTKFTLTMFDN